MSWGEELWDRFDQVVHLNKKEVQELDSVYGRYIKERGELEKEHAKNLRNLAAKFYPREPKKEKKEETTEIKGLRLIMREVGFQANQYEILGDTLVSSLHTGIQKKVKQLSEEISKCKREAKKLAEEQDKAEKLLEKTKQKYQRAYLDWDLAEKQFLRADSDEATPRTEIEKLKKLSQQRLHQSDEYKGKYAQQLQRTNSSRQEYYGKKLPNVINKLQDLHIERIEFLKTSLSECLKVEKEVHPIIGRCQDEIANIIETVDKAKDSDMVIDSLKTGNVPPGDFIFEELQPGQLNYPTMQKRSRVNLHHMKEENNGNLFQKKRELEKKIETQEADISKGHKEIQALQVMIDSYSKNPQFGDKKKFQGELEHAIHKVQLQESELHKYKTELQDIENKLETLKNRTPVHTPKSDRRDDSPSISDKGSAGGSEGSVGYGTISNSSGSDKDNDSLGERIRPMPGQQWDQDFNDDSDDFPPPPSPEIVKALYAYQAEEEVNLSMVEAEEFFLVEEEIDGSGWTKVRSMVDDREGYVPTAFLQRTN